MTSRIARSAGPTMHALQPDLAMPGRQQRKPARRERPGPWQPQIWRRCRALDSGGQTALRTAPAHALLASPSRPPPQRCPAASGFASPPLRWIANTRLSHQACAAPASPGYLRALPISGPGRCQVRATRTVHDQWKRGLVVLDRPRQSSLYSIAPAQRIRQHLPRTRCSFVILHHENFDQACGVAQSSGLAFRAGSQHHKR